MLRKLSLSVVIAVLLAACQTPPQSSEPKPQVQPTQPTGIKICKFRPDACTMQYEPVCGYDAAGRQLQTYGNGCSACGQPEVHGFIGGECNGMNDKNDTKGSKSQ